jgi:hypothetical protein
MGLPKYEVTKILGCIDMRGTPRSGVLVPRSMMVEKCMGSFGKLGPRRGTIIRLGDQICGGA